MAGSNDARDEIARFLGRLNDLPVSAVVVQSALRATCDPDRTNRDIELILEADAGATADVLRLANSAYYGVRGDVRTLSVAVAVIGRDRLAVLLRHLLAGRLLESMTLKGGVADYLHRVALSTAVVTSEASRLRTQTDPDEMMVAGLLHNIGDLAVLSETPDKDLPTLDQWLQTKAADPCLTLLGVDSRDAATWLLEAWGFPSTYPAAARYWMNPESPELNPAEREYATFVQVGAYVARAWARGLEWEEALASLPDSVFKLTGVTPKELRIDYEQIGPDIERLRRAL